MAKQKYVSVNDYLAQSTHPLNEVAQALREVIAHASPLVGEHIKWNSPAYYFKGEMPPGDAREYKRDLVVFNFNRKEYLLLIFPNGAEIHDPQGILEDLFGDKRRGMKFSSVAEVKQLGKPLKQLVAHWANTVGT
ncbi:MAG: DUF1801 domain-containing protein [Bacteroidia bacterium]|jgi:hypothetical protein|nr:DUF1801 domain-containing protein [Bacteroidia bacterium]